MTTEKPAAPLSTSDGARCYIAHFFAREMRRHDFATYIATELAADFACALAQYLGGRQVPVAQVRQNGGHTSPEVWFYPETFYGTKIPDRADLFLGPPAQGIDQWKPIETAPTDGTRLMLWDAVSGRPVFGSWRIGSAHDQGPMTHWAPEPSMPMNVDQRDAAPGVGNV